MTQPGRFWGRWLFSARFKRAYAVLESILWAECKLRAVSFTLLSRYLGRFDTVFDGPTNKLKSIVGNPILLGQNISDSSIAPDAAAQVSNLAIWLGCAVHMRHHTNWRPLVKASGCKNRTVILVLRFISSRLCRAGDH